MADESHRLMRWNRAPDGWLLPWICDVAVLAGAADHRAGSGVPPAARAAALWSPRKNWPACSAGDVWHCWQR